MSVGSHWENEVKVPVREGPKQLSCEAGARLSGEYCAHEGGPQGFLCPSCFSPTRPVDSTPDLALCVWGTASDLPSKGCPSGLSEQGWEKRDPGQRTGSRKQSPRGGGDDGCLNEQSALWHLEQEGFPVSSRKTSV